MHHQPHSIPLVPQPTEISRDSPYRPAIDAVDRVLERVESLDRSFDEQFEALRRDMRDGFSAVLAEGERLQEQLDLLNESVDRLVRAVIGP